MKSLPLTPLLITAAFTLLLPASRIESQMVAPVDPMATIQALGTANDDLLKRQEATLKDLSDMTDTAREVRIFSRRS